MKSIKHTEVNYDGGTTLFFLVINTSNYVWVQKIIFLYFNPFTFFINISCHFKSVFFFLKIFLRYVWLLCLGAMGSYIEFE